MSKLTNEFVVEQIRAYLGENLKAVEEPYGLLTIEINPSQIVDFLGWLKNHDQLQIAFLTLIGGVHYPNETDREFAVVYHLHSLVNNFRLRVKCFVPQSNPSIESVVSLYVGANWMERETYDFFGIVFENHPNLVRILNEDTMDYFPMRKEYHLEDATREDKDDRFFGR